MFKITKSFWLRCLILHVMNGYPSLKFLRSELRNNLIKSFRRKIHSAFIIGSEAKGSSTIDSDIDIAIIVTPLKRKSSLKLSEDFHSNFIYDFQKSKWRGRVIDFQFFYEDEFLNLNIPKIEIN